MSLRFLLSLANSDFYAAARKPGTRILADGKGSDPAFRDACQL